MTDMCDHEAALRDLLDEMEDIFHFDWDFSRACFVDIDALVSENGTFLFPGVGDERNNWVNRGMFLESYRRALTTLGDRAPDEKGDKEHEHRFAPYKRRVTEERTAHAKRNLVTPLEKCVDCGYAQPSKPGEWQDWKWLEDDDRDWKAGYQ